jgi:drug/metabolite transporter (DMT)-like permease
MGGAGALLVAIVPLIGERLPPVRTWGSSGPELTFARQESRLFVYGVISLQIATLGWALGTSHTKRSALNVSPLGGSAMQMLFSGAMLIAIGTVLGEWRDLAFITRTLGAMAYLVIVGSVIGFSAYVYALRHLPITTVSLYAYYDPGGPL